MLFRQLFDKTSSTYTYLLADAHNGQAVLIDSVKEQYERDCLLLEELELQLLYNIETHVHADHITGAGLFRQSHSSKVVISQASGVKNADILIQDGDLIHFGKHTLRALSTPGHTSGCMSYQLLSISPNLVFTGDTLFIRGCGRTDFQEGSAENLYQSVHKKIFSLAEDTLIYPGHDYKGRTVSTVAEEIQHNPRLGQQNTISQFTDIMDSLNLSYPKKFDTAVPANMQCGLVDTE